MKLAAGFVAVKLLAMLAAVAATGCYAGRDCKPGQACWQNCANNPSAPGCVEPWQPIPISSARDGAAVDGGSDR